MKYAAYIRQRWGQPYRVSLDKVPWNLTPIFTLNLRIYIRKTFRGWRYFFTYYVTNMQCRHSRTVWTTTGSLTFRKNLKNRWIFRKFRIVIYSAYTKEWCGFIYYSLLIPHHSFVYALYRVHGHKHQALFHSLCYSSN